MNRRNFLKCSSVIAASTPFVSIKWLRNDKRNSKSLFTIEELQTFCKMNSFHYVEDSEIWKDGAGHKWMTVGDKNYWIYARWQFFHRIFEYDPEQWYDCLRWNAIDWKIRYKEFYLYDIQETTLPFQKENGEFYSMIICAKSGYPPEEKSNNEIQRRIEKTRIYCVKNNCWYKPLNDNADGVYVYDLVKV
jgi:hypothetical protein